MSFDLHVGDCLDPPTGLASLPDGSIDVVVTDPPYSEHVHGKSRRGNSQWRGTIDTEREMGFVHLSAEVMEATAGHVGRLVRRWALVFCDLESSHLWRAALEKVGMEYVRTGLWVKLGGTPQFTGDRPAVGAEAIVIAHRSGKKRWNGGGSAGVWSERIVTGDAIEARVHTTQKPIALMEKLVRLFSDPGELILDPFAGSGTTGVAAIRLGRRFVGWEKDARYHEIARRRLAGAREQIELPMAQAPKAKQGRLL